MHVPPYNPERSRAEAGEHERLRGVGVSGFESRAECQRRQQEMLRRLKRQGSEIGTYLHMCGFVSKCNPCTEGCYFGTRQRRLEGILSAYAMLQSHPGPFYDVSIVHPRWERAVGKLAETNIPAAAQWHYRRLNQLCASGVVAVGIYEVSLNIELDKETYWAGEIHVVVAGAQKGELQRAFAIQQQYRETRPNNKLLAVTPIENLGQRLAYSMKRFVEQRRAYRTKSTGRQARRHLPLRAEHWSEHDAWLLSLPLGARTVAYGCRRQGNKFFPGC